MSNNQIPTYNHRQPPPADYVDPEGRVNNTGHAEVMIYSDSGADVYCLEIAISRWNKHCRWWSPIPPTPPKPRRYEVWLCDGGVIDVIDSSQRAADGRPLVVAHDLSSLVKAHQIADALEGRDYE